MNKQQFVEKWKLTFAATMMFGDHDYRNDGPLIKAQKYMEVIPAKSAALAAEVYDSATQYDPAEFERQIKEYIMKLPIDRQKQFKEELRAIFTTQEKK